MRSPVFPATGAAGRVSALLLFLSVAAACTTQGGASNPGEGAHRSADGPQAVQEGLTRAELEEHALDADTWPPADPSRCGMDPSADPPGTGGEVVTIFFGCTPARGPVLPVVPARRVRVPPGGDPVATALATLLRGPTEEEAGKGYLSNFGAASSGVDFSVRVREGGLAVVDLDPAIRNTEFMFVSPMDVAQIVATVGQFPAVERVAVLVGGRLLCRVLGEC